MKAVYPGLGPVCPFLFEIDNAVAACPDQGHIWGRLLGESGFGLAQKLKSFRETFKVHIYYGRFFYPAFGPEIVYYLFGPFAHSFLHVL
jgi:hypothetical protein